MSDKDDRNKPRQDPAHEDPAPAGERAGASEVEKRGAHQEGGTIFDESGRVTGYTHEGAVSATPGGPIDPTIRPGEGEGGAGDDQLHVVDREDAGALTGDTPGAGDAPKPRGGKG
jgi:hypothetical protein